MSVWFAEQRRASTSARKITGGHSSQCSIPASAKSPASGGARAELERKRTERRDKTLPQTGHRPKFDDFAQEYLQGPILTQKKEGTQQNERQAIRRWISHLGGVRVDKITAPVIHAYREKRLTVGAGARTVNLDCVAVRNVLKFAVERGHINSLPGVKQLKQRPSPRRTLLTKEEVTRLITTASGETSKNSALLRNYLHFLTLTGAREKETLAVRWADVDFARRTVTIGSGGASKNHKARAVDFSPELENLLRSMEQERPPDSSWLFPSPQRGSKDIAARTLRESFILVRDAAKLPKVGFHVIEAPETGPN